MSEIVRYPEKAEELGVLINTERKARGLNPLYMFPYLNECAMIRAEETTVLSGHFRPNGDYFNTVVDSDIVDYSSILENIVGGHETAEGAMDAFRNSSDHWKAIVSPAVTHMGIGMVYSPEGTGNYKWYWDVIFTGDWRENYEYEGQYLPENSGETEEPEIVGAFENADKLGKIVIPESVKKIGSKSFSGTVLKAVKIASDCEYSESSFPEGCGIEFYV